MPEQDRMDEIDATASVVHSIMTTKHIDKLLQAMLHACKTVEEYLDRLNGLLRIFWGDTTPNNKNMDDVKWLDVMMQILSVDNMIPLFKQSMLQLEGKIAHN